jgi:hypothetical protein
MEEPEDPELPPKHMTTKTMERRWGHRALLIGFAPRQYPRVSNYPMISKNMMDLGATVMALRLSTSSKNIGKQQCKLAITPHRRSKVMAEQARKMNNWKLGGTHKVVHK